MTEDTNRPNSPIDLLVSQLAEDVEFLARRAMAAGCCSIDMAKFCYKAREVEDANA